MIFRATKGRIAVVCGELANGLENPGHIGPPRIPDQDAGRGFT